VTPEEAIAAADLIEAETRYRWQLARETGAREYARGVADGYVAAIADVKAVQHGLVLDAQLETLRYGPGGRAHFGDPRPGDYPGRGRREPEPELEAG
jgi:hypothetical protein